MHREKLEVVVRFVDILERKVLVLKEKSYFIMMEETHIKELIDKTDKTFISVICINR